MKTTKNIGLIFLVLLAITVSVSAGGYAPIVQDSTDGSGTVEITVLCHNNLFSKEMLLTNNAAPSESKSIYLDHTGAFSDRFVPGDYTVKLLDGNGGQPETQKFRVDAGYLTRVTFVGHAVSGVGKSEPVETCKDLQISVGNIRRVFFMAWFEIHVTNLNDQWTVSDVIIEDRDGHIIYDAPIYAPPGNSYSFFWATSNSHRTHNPSSATAISNTRCFEREDCDDDTGIDTRPQ